MVAAPTRTEQRVLPGGDGRELADQIAAGSQEAERSLEHDVRLDDMLQNVIHRDDVVSTEMSREVGAFERALDDVVAAGPCLGGYLGLDLDAGTLEVEESAEFVEVAAIASSYVEDPRPPGWLEMRRP